MTSHNVYRDGKVYVCAEKCSTCIFRPGNLMHLRHGRVQEMVKATKEDGATVVCHKTLDGDNAVCRGWWDAYADQDYVLRLARMVGIIREQ